jgi:hypothetical protein
MITPRAQRAQRLAEALGIDLELETAEHSVGGYKLDLFGRDITNDAGPVQPAL